MPSETCFDSETLLDDGNLQIDSYSLCREHLSNALQAPCPSALVAIQFCTRD